MSDLAFRNARVVRSSWLHEDGRRLDCNPYMSGALEARDALRALAARKDKLSEVTSGIFHAGREGRLWVNDPSNGIPFLGSSDILAADYSYQPLLSKAQVARNPIFVLGEHWTLITRSGTIGRMAYVRPDMAGMACSEHVLRVVPNAGRIPPGYLYAFLSSRYGVPLIVSGTYGAIIQHIEAEHIANLPVPRLGEVEDRVHTKVAEAAVLLAAYQRGVLEATRSLFAAVGLKDITAAEWHSMGPDTGFTVPRPDAASLRALNFNPRFTALLRRIQGVPYKKLADICVPGTLTRGDRFKRIDASEEFAVRMIGQRELFWLQPEGRLIARGALPVDAMLPNGCIAVAARGTLGESELYCRAEFVWGPWTELAFSEDILRVIADESVMPRGCLYAFMRSETAFRMLRSISTGSKLQDHHNQMRGELPIPYPDAETQDAIHAKVVAAYEARHRAVALMNEAVRQVEREIGGGQA